MANFVVKVSYERQGGTEIRRITIPGDVDSNFDYISTKVSELFGDLEKGSFQMFWKDEEGDLVVFSSQNELNEALKTGTSNDIFRIVVQDMPRDQSNSTEAVTSPDKQLVSNRRCKQGWGTRLREEYVEKERRPPRWMRRFKEGLDHGEKTHDRVMRKDTADTEGELIRASGFGRRPWRRGEYVTRQEDFLSSPEGLGEDELSKLGNPKIRPNWNERVWRRERRMQNRQHQGEIGTEEQARFYPGWMTRKKAREIRRGNLSSEDAAHEQPSKAGMENGRRCYGKRMWRRENDETNVDDVSFASCQRRRLRRIRQDSIIRALTTLRCQSERIGRTCGDGMSPGKHVHFEEETPRKFQETQALNISANPEMLCPGSNYPLIESLSGNDSGTRKSHRRRGWKYGSRGQKDRCPETVEDKADCSDYKRKSPLVRRRKKLGGNEEKSVTCPTNRRYRMPRRLRQGPMLTDYRLRVLRRLRRIRYLKALAVSAHQQRPGAGISRARRFRQAMTQRQQAGLQARRGSCMASTKSYPAYAPYHGFRRFYGGKRLVKMQERALFAGKDRCRFKGMFQQPSVHMQAMGWKLMVPRRRVLDNNSDLLLKRAFRQRLLKKVLRQEAAAGVGCHGKLEFVKSQKKICPPRWRKSWKSIRMMRGGRSWSHPSPCLYKRMSPFMSHS